MSEHNQPPQPQEPESFDRGMSSIGNNRPKATDLIWYIGGALAIAAIIWLNFGSYFSGKDEQAIITAKQDEQYRVVGAVRDPIIPEKELTAAPDMEQGQPPIDPMLIKYQMQLQELERMKADEARKLAEARKRSPMMVYSKGGNRAPNPQSQVGSDMFASAYNSPMNGAYANVNADQRPQDDGFLDGNMQTSVETVRAGRLSNQDYMIAQGTTIRGVLETAIQSDLAGYIRAIVSEDIYSFDGSQVLIPRGSKVIGRYRTNLRQAQNRLFVVWQRIIRPDGIDIMIDSPGTDYLGRAGLGGDVDTHFMERFGSAILLSMIDGAIEVAVNKASSDDAQTIITGSGDGLDQSAEIALENSINTPPTIHVDQGTQINIFVTKDLDFTGVKPKRSGLSWWQ